METGTIVMLLGGALCVAGAVVLLSALAKGRKQAKKQAAPTRTKKKGAQPARKQPARAPIPAQQQSYDATVAMKQEYTATVAMKQNGTNAAEQTDDYEKTTSIKWD